MRLPAPVGLVTTTSLVVNQNRERDSGKDRVAGGGLVTARHSRRDANSSAPAAQSKNGRITRGLVSA